MKRDTVKTFAGLIIIGGIVVATFLYGNSQRQAQLANDQKIKKQQEAKATAASPSASVQAQAQATNNTAPVSSPASNGIQGSATQTPAATQTPTATSTPATLGATTPVAGAVGGAAPLPETGPEMAGMLGLGSITAMVLAVRSSRRAMRNAARTRR